MHILFVLLVMVFSRTLTHTDSESLREYKELILALFHLRVSLINLFNKLIGYNY